MGRIALLLGLVVTAASAFAEAPKDLTRVAVPDDKAAALKVINEWLAARGIDSEARKEVLVMRKGGVLINLVPIVYPKQLDRLRFASYYHPKDEYKGTKAFEELATKLNRAQNLLQVFVDSDGDLGIASNLTFYDDLTAHHYDAFVELYVESVKNHVLTEEALKMLK